MTPESTFDERECLAFDPFQNTKGDGDERILSDRIVTARKIGPCAICLEQIQPGERVRRQSAIVDGALESCRCCEACCKAMAVSWEDSGEAIEARYALGFAKVHPEWAAKSESQP